MLPFMSLDAVTSPAIGASRDLETVASDITLVISTDVAAGAVHVDLEGSFDGENWFVIASASYGSGGGGTEIARNPDYRARYVRARATTVDANHVVSAWIGVILPPGSG